MPEFDDVLITKSGDLGSPKLGVRSRGGGTQHYSIRVTNNNDNAGGRLFIIRNENANDDAGRDELILDPFGTISIPGVLEVAGDVRLTGADCAEQFPVTSTATPTLEPGTVVVLTAEGRVQQSTEAYDKRVAGVVSGAADCRPGIVLGQQRDSGEERVPIALIGTVYCKIDADLAAVEVGDLLTTSATPGHAMKADDSLKAFGSIVGKALRPLAAGKGLIPILATLQ